MNKKNSEKIYILICAAALCIAAASCGTVEGENKISSSAVTTVTTDRRVETKAEENSSDIDNDDEGYEGYTTSVTVTGAPLENDSIESGYDEDIRATMTTRGTTGSDGGETVTTEFKADELYPLADDRKFESPKTYKVDSDTVYLNLRYGPSVDYNVQIQIPNGEIITGTGSVTNLKTGGVWVYVKYKNTEGWVMSGLLQETAGE